MSKIKIAKGTTSRNIPIFAWHSGAGAPYVDLAYNTAGLVASYRREYQTSWTSIPLSAGSVGSFTSGSIIADGAVGGFYQYGVPNAVFATGADRYAQLAIYGATNLLPLICEFELDEVDYQNKSNFGVTNISGAFQTVNPINVLVTGYAQNVDPATYILATPSYKLRTDSFGSAVVSGKPNVSLSANDITGSITVMVTGYNSSTNPSNLILVNPSNKLDTNTLGQVVVSGGTINTAITGQLNVLVTGYAVSANPTTLLLVNPANKLLTNVDGYVVPSGKPYVSLLTTDISGPLSATVSGYGVGFDPASQVLITSGNKLKTNSAGLIQMDMTQLFPTSNTAGTIGDAFNAMRANGFGKWILNTGTVPPTLDLYGPNGSSIVKSFTLDSITAPTSRI